MDKEVNLGNDKGRTLVEDTEETEKSYLRITEHQTLVPEY